MAPVLFELFGIPVSSWYVFFALAGATGFFIFNWNLKLLAGAKSPEALEAYTLFVICYVSGWFGARFVSVLREDLATSSFGDVVVKTFQLGSMTFYGGAVTATLLASLWCFHKKLRLSVCLASGIPAGLAALGVGRVGCFLNGDDFGLPVPNQSEPPWWAHVSGVLGDGVFRYPTQIQEAIFSILLATVGCAILQKFSSKINLPSFAGVLVVCSAGNRFANEFWRGDPRGTFWGTTLSTSQGVAVLIVAVTFVLWFAHFRKST
jgi:phosphatidylglycerol---prolipoprotein diacylglyceryl transferase